MNSTLIIIIILIIIVWLCCDNKYENFDADTCNNQSTAAEQIDNMGKTAKEACNKISTRAEEIKAEHNGISGIIDSSLAFLSPNNYKSGDNNTDSLMRNIINTNLSECDITKIENACKNNSTSVQSNVIDTSKCPMCANPDPELVKINPDFVLQMCSIKNITQENKALINQTCTIQSAVETLMDKSSSIDAQALANVLQEANGVLSGDNNYKSENCNIINTDMSSAKYLENRSTCSNELSVDQENHLGVCGSAVDVLQKNNYENMQSCLIDNNIKTESKVTNILTIITDIYADLKNIGFTAKSSASSIACSGLVLIFGLVMAAFTATNEQTGKNIKIGADAYMASKGKIF